VTWLGKLVVAVLLLWVSTFLAVLLWQVLWPKGGVPEDRADAIFCLGAGTAETDALLPDTSSARRARACAALQQAGAAPVVVFTGRGNEIRSAAEAMADLARAEGLPAAAALIEPDARSTIQNAAFGLALLDRTPRRVILVSDPFHLPRAWVIFRLLGVREVALHAAERQDAGPTDGRTLLEWSIREAAAIWFNAGRLAVYGLGGLAGVDHDTRIGWFD
jgi:uncharacterized SAM-binding protein YcdF (DUF218 family)